jgi:hypothetical protein
MHKSFKRIKYLGTNLNRELKDLYVEFYISEKGNGRSQQKIARSPRLLRLPESKL